MKTLKVYLAAIASLCMIAATFPCMTYASTAEPDNTGASWDISSDETELTGAAEDPTAWMQEEADVLPAEMMEPTEEETAMNPDGDVPEEITDNTEPISSEAEVPETETVASEVSTVTEEIVGAGVKVGDGVTATFDAATGEVAFYSQCGTLWKDWLAKSGFYADDIKKLWVPYDSGPVYLPEDSSRIFANLQNCVELDLDRFDTSEVTNMQEMFLNCYEAEIIYCPYIDTSNVTNMWGMFQNCYKVERLDISRWNTSNVSNMRAMFQMCGSITELDFSSLPLAKVRDMSSMFYRCSRLHKLKFPQSATYMLQVSDVRSMFYGCENLASLDLSAFSFLNTNQYDLMLKGCDSLMIMRTPANCVSDIDLPCTLYNASGKSYTKLPKNMPSIFLTKSRKIPDGIFVGDGVTATFDTASGHVTFYSDGGTLWDRWIQLSGIGADNIWSFSVADSSGTVYLPENSSGIFMFCSNLIGPDLSGFNTSKVRDIGMMFFDCYSLRSLDLSGFDSSNVEDMSRAFEGCVSLINLNLDGFITGKTTSMFGMFSGCEKLSTLTFGKVNTSHVTSLSYTFAGCDSLTSLDLSKFDTSSVKDMSYAFYSSAGLTSLNLTGWNTSNVENMSNMFLYCSSLKKLDLSNFNTLKVKDVDYMSSGCSSITELNLSGFDLSNVKKTTYCMLDECNSLSILVTPKKNNKDNIALPHTMYDSSGKSYTKLPVLTKSIVLGLTAKAAKDYEDAHTTTLQFKDVTDPTHPYYKAIYWAAENGITKGYSDGTFGINRACTRGHAVMFLWRMAGCPAPKSVAKSPFSDVPKTHTFYKAILWAQQKGITTGYTSGAKKGKFCVDETCTRGQIMTFIWRYKGKPAPKSVAKSPFSDVPTTHTYYKAILWGYQNKITNGYTSGPKKGTFGLNDSCTRGMIVKFLYNIR